MLGTQRPTKMPCSLATSGLPKNQRETLNTKLKKAATKKYFLLIFSFKFIEIKTNLPTV